MSKTKYTIYRDHGNNLLVLDGDCRVHYPVPSVDQAIPLVLLPRVTTDLNNPPSNANPWLCESTAGDVVLFTSVDNAPVWQSNKHYAYTAWSQYPWAPHGEIPVPNVKAVVNREARIKELEETVASYNTIVGKLNHDLAAKDARIEGLEAKVAILDFSGLEARVIAFTGAQPATEGPFALAHARARIAELEAQAEKDQATISSLKERIERCKKLPSYRLAGGMSELLGVPLTRCAKDDIKVMLDKVKELQQQARNDAETGVSVVWTKTGLERIRVHAEDVAALNRLAESRDGFRSINRKMDKALTDALGLLRGTRD